MLDHGGAQDTQEQWKKWSEEQILRQRVRRLKWNVLVQQDFVPPTRD